MSELQTQHLTAATERIKLRLRRTAEDIVAIGQDLMVIKQSLGHGEFLPWIEREFEMSRYTANNFINAAARFSNVELFNISPTVIYELAAPSTSPEVIQQVTAKAEQGESVSVAEVKELKRQLKKAQEEKQQTLSLLDEAENNLSREQHRVEELVNEIKEKHLDELNDAQVTINRLQNNLLKINQKINEMESKKPEVIEREIIKEVEVVPQKYKDAEQAIDELYKTRNELNEQIARQKESIKEMQLAFDQAKFEKQICYSARMLKSKVLKGVQNAKEEIDEVLTHPHITQYQEALIPLMQTKTVLTELVNRIDESLTKKQEAITIHAIS